MVVCVRRCPTLPHRPRCSTIGAVRLSFRVRNVTGRFPDAMTAVTLSSSTSTVHTPSVRGVWATDPIKGWVVVVRVSGTVQWTRNIFVVLFKLSAY